MKTKARELMKKDRTVFYAEQGITSYVERMVEIEGFKSKSDAINYLIALGMQSHNHIRVAAGEIAEASDGVQSV